MYQHFPVQLTHTAANVNDLHASVVEGDKAEKQVQVSGTEDHCEQCLT